jgi:hypothetical protein
MAASQYQRRQMFASLSEFMQVLGTVKNAALVVFCVAFLAEKVTMVQGAGYTIALLGFSWYQYIKTVAPVAPSISPASVDRPLQATKQKSPTASTGSPLGSPEAKGQSAEVEPLLVASPNWHGAINRGNSGH